MKVKKKKIFECFIALNLFQPSGALKYGVTQVIRGICSQVAHREAQVLLLKHINDVGQGSAASSVKIITRLAYSKEILNRKLSRELILGMQEASLILGFPVLSTLFSGFLLGLSLSPSWSLIFFSPTTTASSKDSFHKGVPRALSSRVCLYQSFPRGWDCQGSRQHGSSYCGAPAPGRPEWVHQ